jgi:hypothetical protein
MLGAVLYIGVIIGLLVVVSFFCVVVLGMGEE